MGHAVATSWNRFKADAVQPFDTAPPAAPDPTSATNLPHPPAGKGNSTIGQSMMVQEGLQLDATTKRSGNDDALSKKARELTMEVRSMLNPVQLTA